MTSSATIFALLAVAVAGSDVGYCPSGTGYANLVNAPIDQSTSSTGHDMRNAVNGVGFGESWSQCHHYTDAADPWFKVDLGYLQTVSEVRLHARIHAASGDRLQDVSIYLGNDPSSYSANVLVAGTGLTNSDLDVPFAADGNYLDVPINRVGRYLWIARPGNTEMTLCELQVKTCDLPTPDTENCVGDTGICFQFFELRSQWNKARDVCAQQPGRKLASIHSDAENLVVMNTINVVAYIGAIETSTNGVYSWSDGTPFDYTTSWGDDGLDNTNESRIAAKATGMWSDVYNADDGNGRFFVCRTGPASEPAPTGPAEPENVEFELEFSSETASSVTAIFPALKISIASTLGVQAEDIQLDIQTSRRLLGAVGTVILEVTVLASASTAATAPFAIVQAAMSTTFESALESSLSTQGVSVTVAASHPEISAVQCTVECCRGTYDGSNTCVPSGYGTLTTKHDTSSGHATHRCFGDDAVANGCTCECAF
jgi:hypothetical protein